MTTNTKLGDGVSLLLWPRNYTEYHSSPAGPGSVRSSTHHYAGPTFDEQLFARLVRLDHMYGGSIPGFFPREKERLTLVEQSFARRRLYTRPRQARSYLPYSLVRRVRAIEFLKPSRVLLRDDVDGLGLLLASAHTSRALDDLYTEQINVVIIEPDETRRAWLRSECAHFPGSNAGLTIIATEEELVGDEVFDLTIVQATYPQHTAEALRWAYGVVAANRHILVSLHAPWDTHFVEFTKAAGIEVIDQWREIDVPLLPGGFATDGSGDIVVLRRTAAMGSLQLPEWKGGAADMIDALPYHWLDFDALAVAESGGLECMLDTLALYSERPEFARSIRKEAHRELATWYDGAGFGFTAELNIEEAHLLVTLLPYDAGLEYAVHCAVFHSLGDVHTRMRPHRTAFFRQESIVV